VNRRDLLGLAVAGVALAIPRLSMAIGPRLMSVIYDERYPDARAFAEHYRIRGAASFPTRGDGTGLWYCDSGSVLRKKGRAVAGLTTYSDLVIARSCGRELGLRLAFEASDRPDHLVAWLLMPRTTG
jgi:hypothetical protein